jgi:hypothetical protein
VTPGHETVQDKSSLTEVSKTTIGSSLTLPSFGPIWLDFRSLVGVFEGFLVCGLSSVYCGTVGVENVIFGLDRDSLGELVTVERLI